jgi:hypothetical protein
MAEGKCKVWLNHCVHIGILWVVWIFCLLPSGNSIFYLELNRSATCHFIKKVPIVVFGSCQLWFMIIFLFTCHFYSCQAFMPTAFRSYDIFKSFMLGALRISGWMTFPCRHLCSCGNLPPPRSPPF